MINKIKIVALLLISIAIKGFAQQDPMYTQYMNNPLVVNPAYAGTRGLPVLTGVFRKQWVGIEGAPETSTLSYHSPVRRYNFGTGGSLIYDAIGPVTQTGLYLYYSYLISLSNYGTLSLGLDGGMNYYHVSYNDLRYNNPDDDIRASEPVSLFLPNFGVGTFYYTDRIYLGLSVPKLLRNSLEKGSVDIEHLNREEWHYFFMGGAIFHLNSSIDFKPSFITRVTQGAPLSVDLSGVFMLYQKVWLGVNYRINESVGGIVRWQISPSLEIGYSYDYHRFTYSAFNIGSHEIFISYSIVQKKKRILSPRYF